MKNIHVLPTDKPSRLFITDGKLFNYHKPQQGDGVKIINVNIYITSDEEIKEGDYYIKLQNRPYINRSGKTKFKGLYDNCQKIILTTDQDLIKDGVQAIDDEFLERFVKNQSCEMVEIKSWIKTYEDGSTFDRMDYEIIIPSEERERGITITHKQETIEEAAEKYDSQHVNRLRPAFIAGAKWQQERMYSEEEVKQAYCEGGAEVSRYYNNGPFIDKNEWFEKFKKK